MLIERIFKLSALSKLCCLLSHSLILLGFGSCHYVKIFGKLCALRIHLTISTQSPPTHDITKGANVFASNNPILELVYNDVLTGAVKYSEYAVFNMGFSYYGIDAAVLHATLYSYVKKTRQNIFTIA